MKNITCAFITFFLFFSSVFSVYSQDFSTNIVSGQWEDASSWNGANPNGVADLNVNKISINGNIMVGSIESQTGLSIMSGQLVIKDTLIIYGTLELLDQHNLCLILSPNSLLIVLGDLRVKNQVDINAGGTLIIQGDFDIEGNAMGQGAFLSSSLPAEVYIGGDVDPKFKTNKYPVLAPNTSGHTDSNHNYGFLSDLENEPGNESIWDYYETVKTGPSGGTIEIVGNPTSCAGVLLPSIVNKTEAWPAAYDEYSWEYSSVSIGWTTTASSNIDMIFTTDFPEPNLPEGIYFFRRKAVKSQGAGDPKYSNEMTVTVRPSPAPIGIFF